MCPPASVCSITAPGATARRPWAGITATWRAKRPSPRQRHSPPCTANHTRQYSDGRHAMAHPVEPRESGLQTPLSARGEYVTEKGAPPKDQTKGGPLAVKELELMNAYW